MDRKGSIPHSATALTRLAGDLGLKVVRVGRWLGAYDDTRAVAILAAGKAPSFPPLLEFLEPKGAMVGRTSAVTLRRRIGAVETLTTPCDCAGTLRQPCHQCKGAGERWAHSCAECDHAHEGRCNECGGVGSYACSCKGGRWPRPTHERSVGIAGLSYDRLLLAPLVPLLPDGEVAVHVVNEAAVLVCPAVRVVCMRLASGAIGEPRLTLRAAEAA